MYAGPAYRLRAAVLALSASETYVRLSKISGESCVVRYSWPHRTHRFGDTFKNFYQTAIASTIRILIISADFDQDRRKQSCVKEVPREHPSQFGELKVTSKLGGHIRYSMSPGALL